jgi:GcrA cell cycle regulator
MSFEWTPEAIEEASRLYVAGQHSAAQIGDIIGTTRNAVIGKMNRLGVASPKKNADNVPPRAIREPKPAKLARLPQEPAKPGAFDKIAKGLAEAVAVARGEAEPARLHVLPGLKTITELYPHECRFPVREVAGVHRFCAKPTARGESYCPACRAIVYAPTHYKPRIGHTAGRRFG